MDRHRLRVLVQVTTATTDCCQGFIAIPAHESLARHIHGSTISSARLGNSLPGKHPSKQDYRTAQHSTGNVGNLHPPSGALQVPSTKMLSRARTQQRQKNPGKK